MYVRRKQEQNRNQIVHEVNAGLAFSPTFITVETMRDYCATSLLAFVVYQVSTKP